MATEHVDLAFLLQNKLQQVESAIESRAEAITVDRVQQITSLSGGAIVPRDAEREAIKLKAAQELSVEFGEQVASVATTFMVKLAS